MAQALMEAVVAQHVDAERYERTSKRTGERNGHRDLRWDKRVGSIQLRVPRLRDSRYFPTLLEPRRRIEWALVEVLEAYVVDVSTRRVVELVQSLGLAGMSKSQVSLLCADLDAQVEAFRTRTLSEAVYPYVWLDATFLNGRQ